MASGTIIAEDLVGFAKELRRFDEQKLLREAHRSVSSFVGQEADKNRRSLVGRFPSMRKVEIKPSAATTKVQVLVRKPFGHAAEWGTKSHVVYGRRVSASSMKRPVWPSWGTEGHLVHPVLREKADEIIELYEMELEAVAAQIFPD